MQTRCVREKTAHKALLNFLMTKFVGMLEIVRGLFRRVPSAEIRRNILTCECIEFASCFSNTSNVSRIFFPVSVEQS